MKTILARWFSAEKINKVVLWGGCATRDALPVGKNLDYEIAYLHRSSMAALVSSGTDEFDDALLEASKDIGIASELNAANRDCNASWRLAEKLKDCDIIIIDLTAEREGVFVKTDGDRDIVISAAGRYKKSIANTIADSGYQKCFGYSGKDGFSELLVKGMDVFIDAAQKSNTRMILNEVFAAEKFDDGTETYPWVEDTNKRLKRYYDDFKRLAAAKNINVVVVSYDRNTEIVARKHGHRWGPAAMHFIPDFYELLAKRIWEKCRITVN